MRAVRLHGPGDLRLHEEAVPVADVGEELVRITAVGLCGSDRHWYREGAIGDARLERPLVLGHEVSGVVESGVRRGMRVVVDPADPCGECATCLAGRTHLCPRIRFLGHGTQDGGLRDFMAWPSRLLHRLPDNLGDGEAVLLEPLGVALHALDLARLNPASTVLVIGCGPIGLLLVQTLRHRGSQNVIAVDVLPHRIEAARRVGARKSWVVEDGHLPGPLASGVEVVFEASGDESAVESAVAAAAAGGQVVLVGIPSDDRTTFSASAARRKELTISIARRMRAEDLARALALAASGKVALAPLVTMSVPLADAQRAFTALSEFAGIKTLVRAD